MKRWLSGMLLFLSTGLFLPAQNLIWDRPLPASVPIAPERPSPEAMAARADSLHRSYRFQEAMDLYLSLGQEAQAAASQNALNMTDFCAMPHVVARERFSREDFYLYYPLKPHGWHASPNPLDSLEGHPLYYPKGADVIYFSAPDRSGSRSLFVTEDLDSLWRAPRLVGEELLSSGSEIFPMLSPDGKMLYFASDGLAGMGGYDLYSSAWDPESASWGPPVNMGFPYSSPADDFLLVDTDDGKYTLFASNRDCPPDSVYIYVLDYASSRDRLAVHSPEELARIAALMPEAAVSLAPSGNANTRLYARKMGEARALMDSLALAKTQAVRDSLHLLMEEVTLELRLIEKSFLESGAVAQQEDREVVGAQLNYTFAKNIPGGRLKMKVGRQPLSRSYRVAPVGRFAPDNSLPPGIVYQIELFTSPRHATLDEISGLSPVYERLSPNLRYTYSVGTYASYVAALLDLNWVRAMGFPRARIMAYRDGRNIPVSLARNEE